MTQENTSQQHTFTPTPNPGKPRARPAVRRKRSGCGTCRARKIKCDEGKPVCSRCRSTGRTCDGYGIWGGGGNTYVERYGSSSPSNSPLPVSIQKPPVKVVDLEELRYLQLYRLRVAHTTSGWFGSSFWNATVLPAAASEPAVLHAAVALSAAHRCNFDPLKAPDARERFMLQQYSKAISSLQPLLQHNNKASSTVVLIACQLFTMLEYLRGKHRLAETHLRNGLRMLKLMSTASGSGHQGLLVLGPSSYGKIVDQGIVRSFATLHMQADLLGSSLEDVDVFLRPMESHIPYPTFANAQEAKDSLDTLVHRIVIVYQRFRKSGPGSEREWGVVTWIQEEVTGLLAAWYETYLRTIPENRNQTPVPLLEQISHTPLAFGTRAPPTTPPTVREPLAFKLLLVYHSMATIMCACLRSQFESQYEAYTPVFLSMLEHTVDVFKKYSQARALIDNVNLHDSIGEFGFIAPLYYMAIKCRTHRIRLHAIRILREIPYKEGSWDSFVAANIAHTVMELEERYVYCKRGIDENFSLYEVPTLDPGSSSLLPECSMFHDVQVQMQDDDAIKAVVTCKRWRVDGSLEKIVFHADDKCRPEDEAKRWWEIPPAKPVSLKA